MKLATIAILPLALAISACATDRIGAWAGQPVSTLILAWGPPTREATLSDGQRVIAYEQSYQINATSYYCTATFRVDQMGAITNPTVDGNLGGCNRLVGSKPTP